MGGKKLCDNEVVGLKFGMLTVMSRYGVDGRDHTLWLWACDCGNSTISELYPVKAGIKKSCGCLKSSTPVARFTTHGATAQGATAELKRTFNIWAELRKRCNNKNSRAYQWYGAKGIFVCQEWGKFDTFLADMGIIPLHLTLERLNVAGPYSKENCTLIPLKDQASNKTTTIWVIHEGTKWCLKSLCKHLEIPYTRTWKRLYLSGWSFERALQA